MSHFKIHWRTQAVNLPLGGHSILVIGRGRLDSRARFHPWQPCCYRMDLEHCCGRG